MRIAADGGAGPPRLPASKQDPRPIPGAAAIQAVFPFFVGCGRSGTTMVRALFDAHPRLSIPAESHFLVPLATARARYETDHGFAVPAFVADLTAHPRFSLWNLSTADVSDVLRASPPVDMTDAFRRVYALVALRAGKPLYGDKTPGYVLHLESLAALFPEARFIHVIRDGRDVALSLIEKGWARTVVDAALHWRLRVTRGRAVGRRLGPGRYREVRYEDLVRDPADTLRQLCPFVGIEFDDRMLQYHTNADQLMASTGHPEFHRGLTLPPTPGMRDWRRDMDPDSIARFEAVAGRLLRGLGYERTRSRTARAWLPAHRELLRWQAARVSGRMPGILRRQPPDGP